MVKILLLLFTCCYSTAIIAQESQYNKIVKADIFIKNQDGYAEITGIAANLSKIDQSIRFELAVFKKDTLNNTSKSKQSGFVTVLTGYKAALAKTTINLNIPEQINIMLLIYDQKDQLIGKELRIIKPFTNNVAQTQSQVLSFETAAIRGILVEKTRTKPAKDFYDLFYKRYNKDQISGDQVVTVVETIGQGRTSQIKIKVGYKVIFSFNLSPSKQYIEYMATQSIVAVSKYFISRNAQKPY